jgi:hypothetical protein
MIGATTGITTVTGISREAIDKIVHQTESVDKILFTYSRLIQHVENQNFTSAKIDSLTNSLQAKEGTN